MIHDTTIPPNKYAHDGVIKVQKSDGVEEYVENYIDNEDDKTYIGFLLKLPENKRQRELWDKPDVKKWFLNKLVDATLMHYVQQHYMKNEQYGMIRSVDAPDAYMLKSSLLALYSNRYGIHTKDYKDDATVSFAIPYQLHHIFATIKNKMKTYNSAVDVVLQHGINHGDGIIGDYRYVRHLNDIKTAYISEFGINVPMKHADCITNSIHEIFREKLCSVSDVIDSSRVDKVRSGHSDKDIVIQFNQRCSHASITPSEMFCLYLMLFVSRSDSTLYSIFDSNEIEYYSDRLREMRNKYNDTANDLKDTLKLFLSFSRVMDKKFTKTTTLLIDLMKNDKYFHDIFDVMNSKEHCTVSFSDDVKEAVSKLNHTIYDINDDLIAYQKEITKCKISSKIHIEDNNKLKEIIKSNEQRISSQEIIVNKIIKDAEKLGIDANIGFDERDAEIEARNAEIDILRSGAEKSNAEIAELDSENKKMKNSYGWKIINKLKMILKIK